MTTPVSSFRDDLAYIHDAGFGDFAASAGVMVIAQLRQAGIRNGLVVDLGCGSGTMARQLRDAGYDVIGVDLSDLYRRDFEVHQLQLVEQGDVLDALRGLGLAAETFGSYGSQVLPEGLIGYLARKPEA